jgi:ribosome maturation factor RimP
VLESIAKTGIEQGLLAFCSGHLEPIGFRIVDLDCRIGGRSILRIYIERLSDGQVSLEDCVHASRSLGEVLETYSEIPGKFDLEVSSPGLDRRLRLRSDFENVRGQEVQLKLVDRIEGIGAALKGKLLEVDESELVVESSGKKVPLTWKNIKQANRVWKME